MGTPDPSDEQGAAPNEVEVRSDYVRSRHCVVIRGDFSAVWEDLALHQLQNAQRVEPGAQRLLKDALAGLTLHLVSKPRDELSAWTLNLVDPPLNLFATGDTSQGTIVGRAFTKDVKVVARGRFFVQAGRLNVPLRQSMVEVDGRDPLQHVETYYRQSEQLPARLFRLGGETFAMLVAHPDYDAAWFEAVSTADVAAIAEKEPLGPLELRRYHFACGCDLRLIQRMLRGATGGDLDELYGDQDVLRVECPRCANVFTVSRDAMELFLVEELPGIDLAPPEEPPAEEAPRPESPPT
jgi:molecular chaperone Hsp33